MVRPASLGTRTFATSEKALRISSCNIGDSAKPPTRKIYCKPACITRRQNALIIIDLIIIIIIIKHTISAMAGDVHRTS